MQRTSQSHPLQIATVGAGEGMGRIGITFCPGKIQASAMTGSWCRDLGLDLDAIREWGAAAVVTLVEPHELEELGVQSLGEEVERRHMRWFHLPIPDVSIPDENFEVEWVQSGSAIRGLLSSGHDVVVHCKGGLGRAGTIAARLLVELGWSPQLAIAAIRKVRPGAIESSMQLEHLMRATRMLSPETS